MAINLSETVASAGRPNALAFALTALERGDFEKALEAASSACHAEPARAECHYVYGQVWAALGDAARAERAFAEAIRLRGDFADAWINYGLARYAQGAVDDARTAMRHALAAAPGHPAALANLAAFMRITGEAEAAEALLRDVLTRDPDAAAARLNLAADLLTEERPGEALALLSQATPPDDPAVRRHWLLQRALAEIQVGSAREARATLAALEESGALPPEIAPLKLWRDALLADLEGDGAQACEKAGAMAGAIAAMGPRALPEHRLMAHYDLAKFWSGRGEPARAFAHWTQAHRMLAETQPFSRADHRAFIEACIGAFDQARFEGPRAANRDAAPVFIVGMPRSGTTLCEQILAAHSEVHGAGERGALAQAFRALGGGEGPEAVRRIAARDAPTLDAAAAAYLADLRALAPDKARVVDKMPGNFLYLGLVGVLLPGAKIIHCVRDPRDVGLSIFTFRFYGRHPYAHDLGDLGWYIREHDRLMAHWKAALPNPVLTVHLSDWVEDFQATLARVLEHVGLSHDPACQRFYERDGRVRTVSRSQVRQPVNARGLGRWRGYAAELAPLIEALEA